MHREDFIETPRSCTACVEKCIALAHRPLDWGFSFFKIMESKSSSRLEIPTDYVKIMQRGACEDAILQGPSGHLWHVNLFCAKTWAIFTDGWKSFVSEQCIEVGDILVFRHVGNVHFAVKIFGPSGGEKQSAISFQNYTSSSFRTRNLNLSTTCNEKRCQDRENSTTAASVSSLMGIKPNINGDIAAKDLKMAYTLSGIDSGQSNSMRNLPEFSLVLQKSSVTYKYRITVPKAFVDRWMLKEKVKRSFQLRLLYGKESWEVPFTSYNTHSGFSWREFVVSNGLQKGDKCVFKLVSELQYIFEVHVIKHGVHGDCRRTCNKRNVSSAQALDPREKMKTCVVNPNHSMVEQKPVVGNGSHSPVQVAFTGERKQKAKIEVIDLD